MRRLLLLRLQFLIQVPILFLFSRQWPRLLTLPGQEQAEAAAGGAAAEGTHQATLLLQLLLRCAHAPPGSKAGWSRAAAAGAS